MKANPGVYPLFGPGKRVELDASSIQERALMMMVNEAVMCLQDGIIANPTDGDVGAVFGLGFIPFTGGPFRFIDRQGADAIVSSLERLAERYGARFKPAALLGEHAKTGKKFHGQGKG